MSQVTIYMNNNLEEKVKKIAQSMNISVSKYIATILEKQVKDEWPNSIKQFSGSWDDFPAVSELRDNMANDAPRESF